MSRKIIKNNIEKVYREDNKIKLIYKNGTISSFDEDEEIELIEYIPSEIEIGRFVDSYIPEEDLKEDTCREIKDELYARSFNVKTGEIEFKQIYAVEKHIRKNNLFTVKTIDDREVTVTEDHSLFGPFDFNLDCYPEISVSKNNISHIVVDNEINCDYVSIAGLRLIKKRNDLLDKTKYVYDISVKDNENFMLSNGIFVHNSPFSNVSMYCRETIKNMFQHYTYPDGTSPLDIIETIMEMQKIFMRFISKKDPESEMPYRFPIVTANIFIDKDNRVISDRDFLETLAELNSDGVFNIFITSDKARISSCCRLISNKTDLMSFKGIDSFGNGGLNIGSHRVVTINLPRIARKTKNIDTFKIEINKAIEETVKILVAHRTLIKDRIDQNFLQFFKPLKWLDLDTMFFSTVGLIGIYEACKYLNIDILTDQDPVVEILKECNKAITELANKYQIPINLEQIPGEGAAITCAKKDKIYFGDNEYLLYSNQFIPLSMDTDLVTRAKIDGKLSGYFGGGVITHLNLLSKASKQQMLDLISFSVEAGLDHFALNCCFSKCENDHVTLTNGDICLVCGQQIKEKVTRIVGYFTPVENWVKERREYEFKQRKFLNLNI